ncbi:glycosyltransferase family 4 protein [Pleurocapsales cyanobacterium LEGE 06147]|nr:glycosyltransferase family 4 protein [Pleurocapsales cyanobacterium LEGE 06147]
MKIAFINQPWSVAAPPQGSDSTGIWTYRIARCLVHFHQVIFYGCQSKDKKSNYCHDGIHYRAVSLIFDDILRPIRTLENKLKLNRKLPYFASTLFYFGYILQVALDLRRQQCDIIHIHNFSQFVPIIRAFNPRAKIVLHMHCEWLTQLNREAIARRLERADLIIGCSNHITNKIRDRFPSLAARCQTVYNGVDTTHFVPNNHQTTISSKDKPRLLFVGRVSPEKAIHLLIDAFVEVVKHYPQAQLEIIGPEAIVGKEFLTDLSDDPQITALAPFYSGSYLAHLKNRISPDLAPQIQFTGSLQQEKLLQHYWEADIVINPSLSEAFGMSLVEGMACEKPVIGARVGGMTEAIAPEVTGLLFESGNATALADAIVELLSDEQRRTSMGKAGRKRVTEMFSWEQIAQSLLEQYQSIL